ncbi:hypothetical protein, partial [Thalassolituus marinus]|uniref:hypothetical protein n=1 Tax=Thalassolituus marinus TaxID=671053 RepID=UPI001CE2E923
MSQTVGNKKGDLKEDGVRPGWRSSGNSNRREKIIKGDLKEDGVRPGWRSSGNSNRRAKIIKGD